MRNTASLLKSFSQLAVANNAYVLNAVAYSLDVLRTSTDGQRLALGLALLASVLPR